MILDESDESEAAEKSSYEARLKQTKCVPDKNKHFIEPLSDEQKKVVYALKNDLALRSKSGKGKMRGILLVGPPGTGKTFFAEALANELGYLFFKQSAAQINIGLAGEGVAYVEALFAYVRNEAAEVGKIAILMIDEFDAVAKDRDDLGEGSASSNMQSTLNQLLIEMAADEKNENILVMAATNREEDLDQAVERSGRIDRAVHFTCPTRVQIKNIVKDFSHDYPRCGNAVREINETVLLDEMIKHQFTYPDIELLFIEANLNVHMQGVRAARKEHYADALKYVIKTKIQAA